MSIRLNIWRLIPGLIIVAALAVAGFRLFDLGIIRLNYPSTKRFPVRGIDVSHHQGKIDWHQVKATGLDFAFIKATEGGDFRDPRFLENWDMTGKLKIPRGAYHFFTFCRSGREQAKNYLKTVPTDGTALPIVLDLEFGGNCSKELSVDDMITEVSAFVETTSSRHDSRPIFYVTLEFFNKYLKNHARKFPAHDLWLRNIFYEPRQETCGQWLFWQFANRGRLAGIEKPVDLNVFCGDERQFARVFNILK
jgi:lysozyme